MLIDILSLFPEYFRSPLEASMLKRAIQSGRINVNLVNIRDYSTERFRKVDDRPYGGGPGMVMMAEPLCKAIRAHRKEQSPEASHEADEVISKVIYLSPQGKPLTAALCRELATHKHLILVCGHYEGIDQRVIESDIDDEISIGDYVLTNGCLASLVLLDAVVRFVPGVLGDVEAALFDSFEEEGQQGGLLDWPHYTRPELFETKKVPDVLLSGNHKEIAAWRREQAEKKTKEVRPDLWQKYLAKK